MGTAGRLALALALVLAAAAGPVPGEAAAAPGTPPTGARASRGEWVDFTLPDADGKPVSLRSFIGKKPVLLVFWATWCPQCKESVPVINRLHAESPGKGKLAILALDFMESREKVNRFIAARKVAYPVLLDRSGGVARRYRVVGIPTYILIGRDGRVVYRDHELPEVGRYLE